MPLIKNLPSYYSRSDFLKSTTAAYDEEIAKLEAYTEETKKQFSVQTATKSLATYEYEYGLEQNPEGISIEDRRSRVIARMRTVGTSTKALIQTVINSWANANVYITEHYSDINQTSYNTSNWSEWSKGAGVTADLSGIKFTHDGATNITASIAVNFKANTKYGILMHIVERTDTNKNLEIKLGTSTIANISDIGDIKVRFDITTPINILSVTAGSGASGELIKLKDVRVFEIPPGTVIESDFNNLTAEELNLKYPIDNVDPYFILVTFTSLLGIPANMNDVYNAVRFVMPAHLGVTYKFKYRRHEELRPFTHAQLSAYTHYVLREGAI